MSITIKKNSKPNLEICKMSCDKPLHEKLNKYEMTKTCLNKNHTTILVGKPRQGKSSLIWSWFKSKSMMKKCFNSVFYICPANSMSSMGDSNIFSKLPDDQIFHELNGEILNEIIERAKNREDGDKICIIIDDFASQLKNGDVQKALKQIAMNKRHLGIYTFILSQTFFSLPRDGIRRLADNWIIFKVGKDEMENIFNEILPQYKPISEDIQKIVYDKPHEYLVINTDSGRLFKKFDELIINDE